MNYGLILTTIEQWWNDGLLNIVIQGVAIYIGLLWLGGIIWTMRDSILRSESVLFHSMAFLLSLLTIPGIILYLLIRPSQTVAERKLMALEEEVLRESRQKEYSHQTIKTRIIAAKKEHIKK